MGPAAAFRRTSGKYNQHSEDHLRFRSTGFSHCPNYLLVAVCVHPNAPKNAHQYSDRWPRVKPSEVLLELSWYTTRIFMDFFLWLRETLLIKLAFGDVDVCHSIGGRRFHPSLQFNSLWIKSQPFGFAIEKDVTSLELWRNGLTNFVTACISILWGWTSGWTDLSIRGCWLSHGLLLRWSCYCIGLSMWT